MVSFELLADMRSASTARTGAIETIVASMARGESGQSGQADRHSLFADPTGVGKTKVARRPVLQSGIELVRFDMSG